MSKTVYMVVSNDEFELPALVTESILDVARMFKTSKDSIFSSIYHGAVRNNKYKILRVLLDEE